MIDSKDLNVNTFVFSFVIAIVCSLSVFFMVDYFRKEEMKQYAEIEFWNAVDKRNLFDSTICPFRGDSAIFYDGKRQAMLELWNALRYK